MFFFPFTGLLLSTGTLGAADQRSRLPELTCSKPGVDNAKP